MHISTFAVAGSHAIDHDGPCEKRIQRPDLPGAVERTVVARSQGATIKGFSQETEKGQVYDEAEMTAKGHSQDILILIDASGGIVEIEEQAPFAFPSAGCKGSSQRPGWCGRDS